MRKPHALATAIRHPRRSLQLPVAPRVWQGPSSLSGPAQSSDTSNTAPHEPRVSSSFHLTSPQPEGTQPLAPQLFHLLQLQLRTSLLHTSAAAPPLLASARSDGPLSRDEEPVLVLRRLRAEVSVLGDVLTSHYRLQQRVDSGESPEQHCSHLLSSESGFGSRGNGDRCRGKESRPPVQLLPVPSSAERTWLQPLELKVVRQTLSRLVLAERLCLSVAHGALSPAKHATSLTHAVAPEGAAFKKELTLFFEQCTRIVTTLVALRAHNESDAVPLACLAHVWQASATAGVPVTAKTLIHAVQSVRHEGGSWCSCVPWLLHRYALTRVSGEIPQEATEWSTASAWMTTAADRVCATESVDLLHLSPLSLQRARTTLLLEHAAQSPEVTSGMFGTWQTLLDEEARLASPASAGSTRNGATPPATQHDVAVSAELWSWLTEESAESTHEADGCCVAGGLRPYWRAVVRELLRSGAHAVEVLMNALPATHSASHQPPAKKTRRDRNKKDRVGVPSSSRVQQRGKHRTHGPRSGKQLKEVQFHAMGSYVSLRRISSSLQRHRRLVPLLQLHAMVSGYRSAAPAEEDAEACKTEGVKKSFSAAMAAHHRHRVLTGALMDGGRRSRDCQHHGQQQQQQQGDGVASLQRQVQQAGAMLWREVALLDAYALITLGHVSEHAVDVAALDKAVVLRQLAWLQEECTAHLDALAQTSEKKNAKEDVEADAVHTSNMNEAKRRGSYRLSRARAQVLLSCLTPRTRTALMDKLREGLRLSAKVLARWEEPAMICRLYLSYPDMGASWEVGRALLQQGHYGEAVGVLQALLETPGAGRVAPSASGGAATTLQSSTAVAVRQLSLEAMQGAAAGLVAQQQLHHHNQQQGKPAVSGVGEAAEAAEASSASFFDSDADVPLPAELRAQLHMVYTHATALPVPLPLCLHAFMQGLTEAFSSSSAAASSSSDGGSWFAAVSSGDTSAQMHLSLSGNHAKASPGEALRRTAVLCTYLLRCHITEQPSRGLLAKTVELWATCVARYLCRQGGSSTSFSSSSSVSAGERRPRLSTTDRYLREVTLRLLYGCPHLPVARLLLTRVLQHHTNANVAFDLLARTGEGDQNSGSGERQARTVSTARWLVRHLFRYAGGETGSADGGRLRAYPLCVPAVAQQQQDGEHWWNSDFTERYTLDTLRLMPRIALEGLAHVLVNDGGSSGVSVGGSEVDSLQYVLARVQVALRLRMNDEDAQQQPWQCTTCYLWNGRFASECKRCQTLATVLMQCRSCGFYTSSAGYRATEGLGCEVCGVSLLTPLTGEPAAQDPPPPEEVEGAATSSTAASTVGAATVTGTGRPATLFLPSPSILQTLRLRPWTCTHCQTANQAHHVFFCRTCGRPPPTLSVARDGSTAAPAPCALCGHPTKTVEGRLSPWCERCGALHQLKSLNASADTRSSPTCCDSPTGDCQPHQQRRTPTLWWCVECAATLNPWTRTHCSLCGAGRPAGVAAALSRASAPAASSLLNTPISAASPLITVPWTMTSCGGCQAPQRIGVGPCWKCGAAQTLPTAVQEAITTGWRLWITQATHAAASLSCLNETEKCSDDGAEVSATRATTTQLCASAPPTNAAGPIAPLLLPRAERWLCLRDGCLRLNTIFTESTKEEKEKGVVGRCGDSVCCAACGAPRRHVEILNPFIDRFTWHAADDGDADARPPSAAAASVTAAHRLVEALRLPRAPPKPMDVPVVELPAAQEKSAPERLARVRQLEGAMPPPSCVCCGTAPEGAAPAEVKETAAHVSLFLVHVCTGCGHCSWGRSCRAFDATWPISSTAQVAGALLPGEEALALRLLLRSLTQRLQQAVCAMGTQVGSKADAGGGSYVSSLPRTEAMGANGNSVVQPLDWAWLSRHVLSAVQLIATGAAAECAGGDTAGTRVTNDMQAMLSQDEESSGTRDELLPWRCCDLASPQQLCSAEPRVAVLSDAAGTLHSALRDVQVILESICRLVELRVKEKSLMSRPPNTKRKGLVAGAVGKARLSSQQSLPPCLQDAWTRRLLRAALDLVDVVNCSTVFDEIGFATLRRLCLLLRPHEADHINTETKWCYLQEMKLSRSALLHGCVGCERCLTHHAPGQPCAPL